MSAIELIDLSKRFGSRTAVDHLSLEVHEGDIFGFVGPNGSGKTTTIRMIAGLLQPSGGEARVMGFSSQKSADSVKRLIGYMPDYFGVYPDLHTWEYLDFFCACYQIDENRRPRLIDELLELVDLHHRRDDIVDTLSRGMKQRLSLARTLIHDPQVLLLDEPASGLDPRARVEIRALMLELKKMGKTIFFSTHILSDVAEICTRVGILEAGALAACGEISDLLNGAQKRRQISIGLLERKEDAMQLIENQAGVIAVEDVENSRNGVENQLMVDFEGDDRLLSTLLLTLAQAGLPVLHFCEVEPGLEEVFMQATKGGVT